MSSNKGTSCPADPSKEQREFSLLIYADPYNPSRYLQRGLVYQRLNYPDLAAADAYRALSLYDSVVDPGSCDYPGQKRTGLDKLLNSLSIETADSPSAVLSSGGDNENERGDDDNEEEDGERSEYEPITEADYNEKIAEIYILLVESLGQCGCLRDAYDICVQALELPTKIIEKGDSLEMLKALLDKIKQTATTAKSGSEFRPTDLQVQGYARRSLYPWNKHEPDRNTPEVVEFLNKRLETVAPRCEVRAVALPSLHESVMDGRLQVNKKPEEERVSIQLGLFAKEDIPPGEVLLHESSMLTATNRLHDDICDACNGRLPELSSPDPPVACGECYDTIFCSKKCHDLAQDLYHGAICGQDALESIGKDVPDPKDKADYLYLLLLERAIAMSATQDVHPLELPEVKYIWGDFSTLDGDAEGHIDASFTTRPASATLPFSFQLNVVQPMRILDEMGIDPFKSLERYDTWVLNTLYAKFRGTASGRLSTWDGGPEVCAVHPLWCLANHSCDPNVKWEWGGEITFTARSDEERVKWGPTPNAIKGGIRKGDEILNHYCDIGRSVRERREWAMGALGGACLCKRCVWEEAQLQVS